MFLFPVGMTSIDRSKQRIPRETAVKKKSGSTTVISYFPRARPVYLCTIRADRAATGTHPPRLSLTFRQHATRQQLLRSLAPPPQVEETVSSIKAVPVNAQAAAKQKADDLVAYVKNIPDTVSKAAKVNRGICWCDCLLL